MTISRRMFFSFLFAPALQTSKINVSILEVFETEGMARAVLVNQVSRDDRDAFATWLQSRPESRVRVHATNGVERAATIFRVRMCFGRGLILFDQPIRIREREKLTIVRL